jgi:hypothetical protein
VSRSHRQAPTKTKPSTRPRAAARGRPPKYGRRSQVIAVTLPEEVVKTLRRTHSDLGWAIVSLVERNGRGPATSAPKDHAQLVQIGEGEFLIVVNSATFRALPSVQMVPFSASQAFLALEPGRGIADLELAVRDRLESLKAPTLERRAILRLAEQLRNWRRSRRLEFHARSIIVVGKRPARQ